MKNQKAWINTTFGSIFSALGVFGAACSFCGPACCAAVLSGPLVAVFGIGVAGFFHKYSIFFIILGVVQFVYGSFLFWKFLKRKKSVTSQNLLK